jgi:hypothetical protein
MRRALALGALAVWVCSTAQAGPIYDASFFSSITHTLITFETDRAGNPLNIPETDTQILYSDEYSPQGVVFDRDIYWVNEDGNDFEAAQAIGGSPEISIPGPAVVMTDLIMSFNVPVKAFGLWVIDRNNKPNVPSFQARNASGGVIETVTFQGAFVDRSVGIQDYGLMGIYAEQNIASVKISYDYTDFDNLMFSPVPEPGCAVLLAAGAAAIMRRRTRRQAK